MTAREALGQLREYVVEQKNKVYDEMDFARKHNFELECAALQYKSNVLSDINGEIMIMLHQLNAEEE